MHEIPIETALITGASSGIGTAFAKELAARQSHLILVARSQDKLEKLAKQLQQQFKIQVDILVQDLTAPGATKSVFEVISQKGLTVDLLINNAGFGDYGAFSERQLKKQIEMIQLNITALVELTHMFLPLMQQRRKGGIINLSSIAAYQPLPYLSVYAATKAFVLSFSEALWAENKRTGVRILALCPGPTESQFFEVAEFPKSLAKNGSNQLTPAEDVVRDALKSLEKNQPTLVTGGLGNQIIVNLPRFLPRDIILKAVEKQFKA
jgi:short-subunit dehydrogenase